MILHLPLKDTGTATGVRESLLEVPVDRHRDYTRFPCTEFAADVVVRSNNHTKIEELLYNLETVANQLTNKLLPSWSESDQWLLICIWVTCVYTPHTPSLFLNNETLTIWKSWNNFFGCIQNVEEQTELSVTLSQNQCSFTVPCAIRTIPTSSLILLICTAPRS